MNSVYGINDFEHGETESHIYVNKLSAHVKTHSFTNLPHKHNFYLFMLVTKGSGTHEIDFVNYPVKPGSVFLMKPGQMHFWKLSKDIDGVVFFHSREFYDEGYTDNGVYQFSFFNSPHSTPYAHLHKTARHSVDLYMRDMYKEFKDNKQFKTEKLRSLINLIYIEVARSYSNNVSANSSRYLNNFNEFEQLLEQNYREHKLPGYYASQLHMTEKHLNRVCRNCVDKTTTQIIADRIVLEAKRILSQGKDNVTEAGYELGFSDPSYFVRFYKKQTGHTPSSFQKKIMGQE